MVLHDRGDPVKLLGVRETSSSWAKRELNPAYVGSYCASSARVCIERRKSYCCFTTPLARILNEQVRRQLERTWVGEASDCAASASTNWRASTGAGEPTSGCDPCRTGHYPTIDTLNLAT